MKRHPYITATIIATVIAVAVWFVIPKEYTAITKISDEYKEVDIAIGLDQLESQFKNITRKTNHGINNIEVYAKILKSEDLAKAIAQTKIPSKNITYGEYLNRKDTTQAILDNINYNLSPKYMTVVITFTDKDPVVASQMLDSVTSYMQATITSHRHMIMSAVVKDVLLELEKAKKEYREARQKYDAFSDSHLNMMTEEMMQERNQLELEYNQAYIYLKTITTDYLRGMALMQRTYKSFAVIKQNSIPLRPNQQLYYYLIPFVVIALFVTYLSKKFNKKCFQRSFIRGNIFSPWNITLLIWIAIIGLYYLLDTRLEPITSQFYNCLALWIPIFLICSILTFHASTSNFDKSFNAPAFHINKRLFYFFFIITLFITPVYLYRIYTIITMFDMKDMMYNIRTLAVYGEGQGILNYSQAINQSLFIVALWAHPKIPTWTTVVLGIACLMNSLAIMEKGTMFFVAISTIFVLYEKQKIKMRSILVWGIAIIIIFYFFNLLRAEEDSEYQKEETLLDFIAMYVLSPPVAFCKLLPETIQQFGTNTFETIYLFLARFGVTDIVVKDKLQEFVYVPISTNVYTVFQPFFIDFGYKGVAFFAGFYGWMCGIIYRLYKQGNSSACCFYTYLVYILTLQFYQENLFYSMVAVLQFVFFTTLLTQDKLLLTISSLKKDEKERNNKL